MAIKVITMMMDVHIKLFDVIISYLMFTQQLLCLHCLQMADVSYNLLHNLKRLNGFSCFYDFFQICCCCVFLLSVIMCNVFI